MNLLSTYEIEEELAKFFQERLPYMITREDNKIHFEQLNFTTTFLFDIDFNKQFFHVINVHKISWDESEQLLQLQKDVYQIIPEFLKEKQYSCFLFIYPSDSFDYDALEIKNSSDFRRIIVPIGEKADTAFDILEVFSTNSPYNRQDDFFIKNKHIHDKNLRIVPRPEYGCVDIYYVKDDSTVSGELDNDYRLATLATVEQAKQFLQKLQDETNKTDAFIEQTKEELLGLFPNDILFLEDRKFTFFDLTIDMKIIKYTHGDYWHYRWVNGMKMEMTLDDPDLIHYLKQYKREKVLENQLLRCVYDFDPYSFILDSQQQLFFLSEVNKFRLRVYYKKEHNPYVVCEFFSNGRSFKFVAKQGTDDEIVADFRKQLKEDFGKTRMKKLFKEKDSFHYYKALYEVHGVFPFKQDDTYKEFEKEFESYYFEKYEGICPELKINSVSKIQLPSCTIQR